MKTRTVKDVVADVTKFLDKEGIHCIGFLVNCRSANSTIQLKWGDTRPHIPRRKKTLRRHLGSPA